jgi:hypothetical protein
VRESQSVPLEESPIQKLCKPVRPSDEPGSFQLSLADFRRTDDIETTRSEYGEKRARPIMFENGNVSFARSPIYTVDAKQQFKWHAFWRCAQSTLPGAITFENTSNVSVRIDCNRGKGSWKSEEPGKLEFGPLALTRAMCPPKSLNDRIPKDWPHVRSFIFKDGHLFLSLIADGGTYDFEPLGNPK